MDPEILKRLDAMAEKFGATGERLWAAMVRYEVGVAWAAVVGAVVAVAAFLFAVRWMRSSEDRLDALADGHPGYVVMTVFGCSLTLIAVVIAICNLPGLVSPEAAALKSLLGK